MQVIVHVCVHTCSQLSAFRTKLVFPYQYKFYSTFEKVHVHVYMYMYIHVHNYTKIHVYNVMPLSEVNVKYMYMYACEYFMI